MSKIWSITLKSLFLSVLLLITFLANAQQAVNSDELSQPITKETQVQILELLAMDCNIDLNLNKFTAKLEKFPVDVSPVFIKILQQGVPEEILQSVRKTAKAKYETRQAWLKSKDAELFDIQTVKRLSEQSFDDYLANKVRKLNIQYKENALLGLKQVGKLNAIDVIKRTAILEPGLAILGEKAIKSINQRKTSK